jgi:DNA-directed RNA polymerase specialized sigma24 family protein
MGDLTPAVFAKRPRHRRPDSMIPRRRRDRLEAARLVDFEGFAIRDVAKVFRRSEPSIKRWLADARTYPEYQTLLRRFAS